MYTAHFGGEEGSVLSADRGFGAPPMHQQMGGAELAAFLPRFLGLGGRICC